MLEAVAVAEIARQVAVQNLGRDVVSNVDAEPMVDSEGRDALRILVTVKDDYGRRMSESSPSRTLLALSDALIAAGDERFPFIEYATEAEIAEDAGPES